MKYMINVDKLREDLKDYYGTAVFGGFPMAMIDLSKIELASPEELVAIAQQEGLDLRKYIID